MILLVLFGQSVLGHNDQLIDSLENSLTRALSPSEKVEVLFQLSDLIVYNDPKAALAYSEEALIVSQQLNENTLIGKAYYQIGTAYWSIGELANALEQLQKSLTYIQPGENAELSCRVYMRIGAIYTASDDNIKGLYYYNKAIPYFKALDNDFVKFAIYNNMGKALMSINYLDSAQGYLDQAGKFIATIPSRFHPIYLFNIADLQYQQKDIKGAMNTMAQCDSLARQYKDLRSQIRVAQLTAEIALKEGDYQKGINQITYATEKAEATGVRELIAITNETYSKLLEQTGDTEGAFEALKISRQYYDSIRSTQSKNQLELYNFDESEQEKEELRRLQEISELKASNQQQLTVIAVAIAFLMVAIALTIFRSRQLIKVQNDDLQKKNLLIEQQKQQLDDLNVFKTKVMGIMAHDVKNPIQTIFGVIDLLDNKMLTTEELQTFLPHVSDQLSHVSLLLNNIFEWSRAGLNEESVKPYEIEIANIIDVCKKENKIAADAKKVNVENLIPPELVAVADSHLLKVVVRNLLHNAIKYSNEGDTIVFEGKQQGDNTIFSITDQGVGMSEETINKLFSYNTESEIGTAQEIGTGFGLIVCKDFVEMNKGTISVKSKAGQGTTFTIVLPTF